MIRPWAPKAIVGYMAHHHLYFALLAGWPLKATLVLAALGFMLPDVASTLSWLGAVAVPVGVAIATGYIVFLNKVTPARIKAMQDFDAAQRETTMGKLADAHVKISENEARIEALERDLHEERIHSARMRDDIESFAVLVLSKRGIVALEDDGRTTVPTPAPVAIPTPTPGTGDCP